MLNSSIVFSPRCVALIWPSAAEASAADELERLIARRGILGVDVADCDLVDPNPEIDDAVTFVIALTAKHRCRRTSRHRHHHP
jgi:hypothetical protein